MMVVLLWPRGLALRGWMRGTAMGWFSVGRPNDARQSLGCVVPATLMTAQSQLKGKI